MRKLLIVACALFVVFVASHDGALFAAKRPGSGLEKALCTATANCGNGTTVSCQGNNSTTSCSAIDRACNTQRGSVTCDGVTTLCPTACPTTTIDWCKECAETEACVACCRCNGGTGCLRICQEF